MNFPIGKRIAFVGMLCPGHSLQTLLIRAILISIMLIATSGLLIETQARQDQSLDKLITVSMVDEPIQTLLTNLEHQTGLTFVYNPTIVIRVTVKASNIPMRNLLDSALKNSDYVYKVSQNTVAIIKADQHKENIVGGFEPLFTTIKGRVIDASTQESLAGVNIVVKGSTRGTTSTAAGHYTIDAQNHDILVFSFIGFKTFETQIGGRSTIDIALEPDATPLNPVEVIGNTYYSSSKAISTSSIIKISSKDIETQPVVSPLMALQGRVPGLDISPNTGAPGNAPTIKIRGTNSIRPDKNQPLYIIDGIPVESQSIGSTNSSTMSNGVEPLVGINPENIESIEVLKDGDATAIYGSRGANGVIVIRTKKSKQDHSTVLDMTAYTGAGKVARHLNMLSSSQYLAMRREAFRNDGTAPTLYKAPDLLAVWDTTRYTDLQKVMLGGTSHTSDVQANLSGGTGNTSFRLGGGFHNEGTIFPGDFGFRRTNAQLNVNHSSTDTRFNVSAIINYAFVRNSIFDDNDFIAIALTAPPVIPALYTPAGELNFQPGTSGTTTFSNPLRLLKKENKSTITNLMAGTLVSYEITPGLWVKSNIGYTELTSHEINKIPVEAAIPELRPINKGQSKFGLNQRRSWIIEPQLQYAKHHGDHTLDVFLGATYQGSSSQNQVITAEGYTSDAALGSLKGASHLVPDDNMADYKYTSIITRVGYNFRQTYLFNLTMRRDGSSRFGPGHRWGNFGSAGAGWIFSKASWTQGLHFLSFGKLRGSYAVTGSDQIGDYGFYDTYTNSAFNYQSGISLSPTALYNPNYRWESTTKIEGALELGFLRNRLMLEVNVYRNRSSNQLVNYQLPATTGFPFVLKNFEATVENRGWEFMISGVNISHGTFTWSTSANLTLPRNVLTEFPDIKTSSYADTYAVGQPLSVQRRYIFLGADPRTGSNKFLDITGDGTIDDHDKQFNGDYELKYYGGLTNTLQFKGIALAVLLQLSNRHTYRYMKGQPGSSVNQPDYVLTRWQKDGDITPIARFSQSTDGTSAYTQLMQSDYMQVDATFIRLKTLTLSYSIPGTLLQKARLTETKIFVQGQNLYTKTNYYNLDPETGSNLPPLRMCTVGLQVKI